MTTTPAVRRSAGTTDDRGALVPERGGDRHRSARASGLASSDVAAVTSGGDARLRAFAPAIRRVVPDWPTREAGSPEPDNRTERSSTGTIQRCAIIAPAVPASTTTATTVAAILIIGMPMTRDEAAGCMREGLLLQGAPDPAFHLGHRRRRGRVAEPLELL